MEEQRIRIKDKRQKKKLKNTDNYLPVFLMIEGSSY